MEKSEARGDIRRLSVWLFLVRGVPDEDSGAEVQCMQPGRPLTEDEQIEAAMQAVNLLLDHSRHASATLLYSRPT